MRLLSPAVRPHVIHLGQMAALAATAVLAMAAAPSVPADQGAIEISLPEAPPVTAVAEPAGPVMREILFERPVRGYEINSRFGLRKLSFERQARHHKGVDIAAPQGTSVFAAAEGEVIRRGYDKDGYGNFVEVRHPNGMTTLYGHLSRVDLASGDNVYAGSRIGLVGSTGRSTGPHLHFEVRRDGQQVDPARVMGQTFEIVAEPAQA
ncbi:MAG: M23 family metallopeptidase [Brevundimonas sp.]|uniref:M23 family metallopeptidase n=1 Tax=Brevundimonas sp. TaxID=1871086 RepID=UPI001211E8D8|nr:M23 family metallopeptidase [Brevundimonas sp.]RZJ17133.1 MAG: M23 family metallopeptidase [Brevundimonas sp.]